MFPAGLIALWFGSIGTIPAGWVRCDGNNGTPDLTAKFVIGANFTYPVDDTGGSATHLHAFTGDGHTHTIAAGADIAAGANKDVVTDSGVVNGATNQSSSLPPYHALAYIMKT